MAASLGRLDGARHMGSEEDGIGLGIGEEGGASLGRLRTRNDGVGLKGQGRGEGIGLGVGGDFTDDLVDRPRAMGGEEANEVTAGHEARSVAPSSTIASLRALARRGEDVRSAHNLTDKGRETHDFKGSKAPPSRVERDPVRPKPET